MKEGNFIKLNVSINQYLFLAYFCHILRFKFRESQQLALELLIFYKCIDNKPTSDTWKIDEK